MAEAYLRRRSLAKTLLDEIPGVITNNPEGAFYIFPDVSAYFGKSYENYHIGNAYDLCIYLLNEAHISLVDGDAFGAPECIRISTAAADEQIREAIRRMKEALAKLK
jgi:aspartate aminotransferase